MAKKTSERRKAAFCAALAKTGNQSLAAERARVSRSWVTLHRSTDPEFRAVTDAAIAAARLKLSGDPSDGVPGDACGRELGVRGALGEWAYQAGEELAIRGANHRRAQVTRARPGEWTARLEARFLSVLGATCNVTAAAQAVGITRGGAYAHRRKWGDFRERWAAALETGYAKLEFALVNNACALLEGEAWDAGEPIPPMTVDQAIHFLSKHKRTLRGIGKPGRYGAKPVDVEALKAEIVRKVNILSQGKRAGFDGKK